MGGGNAGGAGSAGPSNTVSTQPISGLRRQAVPASNSPAPSSSSSSSSSSSTGSGVSMEGRTELQVVWGARQRPSRKCV